MMRDCIVLIRLVQRRRGLHVSRVHLLVALHAGVHLRHLVGILHVRRVPICCLALLKLPQAFLRCEARPSII